MFALHGYHQRHIAQISADFTHRSARDLDVKHTTALAVSDGLIVLGRSFVTDKDGDCSISHFEITHRTGPEAFQFRPVEIVLPNDFPGSFHVDNITLIDHGQALQIIGPDGCFSADISSLEIV